MDSVAGYLVQVFKMKMLRVSNNEPYTSALKMFEHKSNSGLKMRISKEFILIQFQVLFTSHVPSRERDHPCHQKEP
jgi:hypothetical protein